MPIPYETDLFVELMTSGYNVDCYQSLTLPLQQLSNWLRPLKVQTKIQETLKQVNLLLVLFIITSPLNTLVLSQKSTSLLDVEVTI